MQLQQRWTFVLSKITWLVNQPLTVSAPVIPQNIWNKGMLDCAFRVGSNNQLQTRAESELSREGLAQSQLRSLNLPGADLVFPRLLHVLVPARELCFCEWWCAFGCRPQSRGDFTPTKPFPATSFPRERKIFLSSRARKWQVRKRDKAWKSWNHAVLTWIDSIFKRRMGKNYLFWWRNYKNTWKKRESV